MEKLRPLVLLVRPDTLMRWHRDLLRRRHVATCAPRQPGRPRTVRSIRALVSRLARENSSWGYRRIHGELAALGIRGAASTVWEIVKGHGIAPSPQFTHTGWANFLRNQAGALLACDFFEVRTLTGPGSTSSLSSSTPPGASTSSAPPRTPPAPCVTQLGCNLLMDLHEAGTTATFLIRDRDAKFTAAFDAVLADAAIQAVTTGIRIP